jgi:NAD(P) transhydrogenase
MGESFDMVVIGGGPAGEKGAAQAAYWGKRVALVDRGPRPGGTLAGPAVASKALREAALYLTGFRRREVFGAGLTLPPEIAFQKVRERAERVVATMSARVEENLARHDVALVRGEARLAGGGVVTVEGSDGSSRKLEASVILLATGSRALRPPGIPFDDPDGLDADSGGGLDSPVDRVVVVGGGAVGCEYATIFAALGAKVTLIDNAPRLLRFLDAEAADVLAASLRRSGVEIVMEAGHAGVERTERGLEVVLPDGRRFTAGRVIFAGGRVGNTEGIGLEEAGVDVDERGRIVVDSEFRTSAPGVWAAGDVIGPPALASVSMEQARVATCRAFNIAFKQSVDEVAPFGVYSIPEVAMVGKTAAAAEADGEDVAEGRAWLSANSRSAIAGDEEGFLKLVFRRSDATLLGVHIVGSAATELIHLGQAVMHYGGTIDRFIDTTYAVPSVTELYKYAAYDGLARIGR